MAIALVANSYVADTSFNGQSSAHIHSGTNSVIGNLLVIHVGWVDATTAITGVADTGATGAAWTKATGNACIQGNGLSEYIYYTVATAAAAYTVTATWPGNVPYVDLRMRQFSGFTDTPTLDQVAGATGSGTTAATGNSGATTVNDELVVAGGETRASYNSTLETGYEENITTPNRDISGYKVISATGAQSASATLDNGTWAITLATFKNVAAAGGLSIPVAMRTYQNMRSV